MFILNKHKKSIMIWFGKLSGLRFRGLYFTYGGHPDYPTRLMFPEWKIGWLDTQMNRFLFL